MDTNKYVIVNNPLLYAEENSEIQEAVNNIYNQLKNIKYVPSEVYLLEDYGIECGDIIRCEGRAFYVMEKKINASGVVITCMGSQDKNEESTLNSTIIALRGKTNELVRDITQTKSLITDESAQRHSEITQTASAILLEVGNTNNSVNAIEQTLNGVVFRDTETGQTVIDGSHITTGTINAQRIDLTGSVDYNDLSNSCKQSIAASSAGIDVQDVKNLLNNTYAITHTTATGTTINSPTIQGGTIVGTNIYAGTASGDYYVALNDSGLTLTQNETNMKRVILGNLNNTQAENVGIMLGNTTQAVMQKYYDSRNNKNYFWIGNSDMTCGIRFNFTNNSYKLFGTEES